MRNRKWLSVVLLTLAPAAANAQSPLHLSVGGGASFPVGSFADAVGTGWHALASLGLSSLMQPIGIRLDGAYNRFNGESDAADVAITSGTLNLTYRLPVTNSPISPYVIAGAGAYRAECVGDTDCGSTTKFGWNAGLGTKFVVIGLHGFLESRFHATETGSAYARYIPVTLGLTL